MQARAVPVTPTYLEQLDLGREAAVHAQKLVVDQRGERQRVEDIHHRLPHQRRVLVLAFLPDR